MWRVNPKSSPNACSAICGAKHPWALVRIRSLLISDFGHQRFDVVILDRSQILRGGEITAIDPKIASSLGSSSCQALGVGDEANLQMASIFFRQSSGSGKLTNIRIGRRGLSGVAGVHLSSNRGLPLLPIPVPQRRLLLTGDGGKWTNLPNGLLP